MAKYLKTEQGYIDASIFAPASFKPAGKSYLTFSSPKSFTLKVNDSTKHWDGTLEYFSADKVWAVWDGTTILSAYNNDGEYVLYLRGTGNTVITGRTANGASDTYRWVLTGSDIACVGNIENLLDYATVESGQHPTMAEACYVYMFFGCTSLTQAPTLTATTLADYCYCGMFVRCTSLTQTPVLPAITLSYGCYQDMFFGCTGLTQAPALPATTLASYCYSDMFYGCTGLTQAPALPVTTLASYCYYQMFWNCTNLTQAPALPATTLAEYCYRSMFSGCTSLTKAPALPATTLANNCYERMFRGCTSLTQAPALPATTLANNCYKYMFENCTSLKLSNTKTGEYTQEYRIPSSGTGTTATQALNSMFAYTGGTFRASPAINTTYYLSTDNMIVRDTEVATLNGYVGSMIDVASIQSDWNQNDETAPDYVKNRPFYTGEPVETVLVEESTATFTQDNGVYIAQFPSTFEATVGETYKVSWDGTVYECTCVKVNQSTIIGNLSIEGTGSDTGEPFLMDVYNGVGMLIAAADTSASHTFSISGAVAPVVKIDKKYLPDVRSDWNVNDETSLSYVKNRPFYTGDPVETVLLEETTVSFSNNGQIYVGRLSSYTGSFPDEGKIYDVNWDGSIYQCTCYLDGSIPTLGVLGNPDPFSIAFLADSSSLGIVTKTANSHTISISGFIDEIVKIDKKYLPELPKLPYMAEENPTGTGAFSLNRMVGSHVGIESFAEGSSTEAIGDASHAEGENTKAFGAASHAEGYSSSLAPNMSYISNTAIINAWKNEKFTLAKGSQSHAEGENVLALGDNSHAEGVATFANGDSSHVQGKFNIADDGNLYAHIVGNGTSDASRSNAHTLDWSGNAWFAGTVEGKALILSSSTENSSKKFKITVDDSGAITATEVT